MGDFILKIPKWRGRIEFSQEVITLVIVIMALTTGVTMCFWGYRYFQTLVKILFGCICGMTGFHIGQIITSNSMLQMYIFVMSICLGICLLHFLLALWIILLRKPKIQSFVQRSLHIIAAVSGALIVGSVIYTQVFCNLMIWHCHRNCTLF